MSSQLENVWKNYAEKDVHNIFIILKQDLYMDKLQEMQNELQRDLNHYEWNHLGRNGFIGFRRTKVGRRTFDVDEDVVLDVVRGILDGVLITRSTNPPKPLIVMGRGKITYA